MIKKAENPKKKKAGKKEGSKTKRGPDGRFLKGSSGGRQFQKGKKGGPGRPKGSLSLVAALKNRLKDNPNEVDEIVKSWIEEIKLGSSPHLTSALDRIDGKVPDYTIIVKKIEVDVVHLIAKALPTAFLIAGYKKKDAHEIIVNVRKLLQQEEVENDE